MQRSEEKAKRKLVIAK